MQKRKIVTALAVVLGLSFTPQSSGLLITKVRVWNRLDMRLNKRPRA